MTAFPPVTVVTGVPVPLLRDNIDTDAIIPSREIRTVGKTGLAGGLFAGWRYRRDEREAAPPPLPAGERVGERGASACSRPSSPLEQEASLPGWRSAPSLDLSEGRGGPDAPARASDPAFVLNDPRFAGSPILLAGANFGCGSSREHAVWALHEYGFRAVIAPGFAPIFAANAVRGGVVPVVLDAGAVAALAADGGAVTIDLAARTLTQGVRAWPFAIRDEAQAMLLGGLDAIDLTLTQGGAIAAFHARDRAARPWVYDLRVEVAA